MDNILAISGLTKRFGSKQVLNGVTLSVPETAAQKPTALSAICRTYPNSTAT